MARKEALTAITPKEQARVAGYYEDGGHHGHTYQYQGFKVNKYYTSDRFERLTDDFRRPNGQPMCGIGLEIETACGSICDDDVLAEVMDKMIFSHFPADLFKFQHDGSLSGRSTVECITQVMTKLFIRNHYKEFKLMYDHYFRALGIRCNSSCGMHTNISMAMFGKTQETQEEAVRKLFYIVNKHFALCCGLFNRSMDHTMYCRQMNYDSARTMNLHGLSSSHGVCFNLGHVDEGRIELRLVGPQTSFGCFRNTMECVFHLIDRVKRISWADCDDMVAIFSGCNQYVYDRLKKVTTGFSGLATSQLETIRDSVKRENLL